ncbi:MAG TPA: DUF6036 family nucleotidyltransferase [Polyangiaceae bacterium]|nr:DUF6036 family nucleotidyltransferase [Polyangiaceae bacterium]
MKLPPDFVDLLVEFANADVRYLIIGGYAVGFHDRPRTTKDLDVLLDADADNIAHAVAALVSFGAPDTVAKELVRATADEIVWFGTPPARIDLLKSAPGVDFTDAYGRRVEVEWSGAKARVISLDDLILSKHAAARPQDLVDAKHLERARASKKG